MITIYGSSLSPFVRKVLVAAAEMGIDVASKNTPPRSEDAEFREVSPFGKIPGLRDGDFTLSDSSAIAFYLDALRPQAGLIPVEPQERARTVWFDEFADTIFADAVLKMFFNRIVGPKFMGLPGDEAVAALAQKEELPPILDWLDGQISPSGYLVGDRLTLADISVASLLVNLQHLGIVLDGERNPDVVRFAQAMLARPSFAGLIERESAFLARFA